MTEKIRPLTGHLWAKKYTPGLEQKLRTKFGTFEGQMHESGLFVVGSTKSNVENDVLAKMYIVEAVGKDPVGWPTKWFLPSREDTGESWRHWHTSFEEQNVSAGVIVAASAKAGMRNPLMAEHVQLRHDELVAIGKPLDPMYDGDEFPMFAAPGWVIVANESAGEVRSKSQLVIRPEINTRVEHGGVQWGRVVEVQRGASYLDLGNIAVGLRVGYPYAQHAAGGDMYAYERVDFEGGYTAIPLMCLLAIEYQEDPENLDDARIMGFDDGLESTRRWTYRNPYVPGSPAWAAYDLEHTEGSCK